MIKRVVPAPLAAELKRPRSIVDDVRASLDNTARMKAEARRGLSLSFAMSVLAAAALGAALAGVVW